MRRKALLLFAVSCLVVLAGCSGALTGSSGADEPTLEDASYPAGVSDDGTNLSALSATHAAELNGSSFTLDVDVTQNASTGNQSMTNRSMAMHAAVGPDRDNVRVNVSGASQSMSAYTTAEKRYLRMATDSGVVYRATERSPDAVKLVSSSYSGTSYFDRFGTQAGANFTPTGVREVNGTTLIVLEADGSNVSVEGGANVTHYDATILVDEQGVVHRFETTVESERDGTTVRISFTMTISDVNGTAVEEPPWLDEARNRTSS